MSAIQPQQAPTPELDELFGAFHQLLVQVGPVRGLIGPREIPRLWQRHILNCAALTSQIPADVSVVDIGSGAGLPGLVVALARPDLNVVLIDSMRRRTDFLTEAVELLELNERVRVIRGRAEECVGEVSGDIVTARAVAPLDKLVGWAMPLLKLNGSLLAMKGEQAAAEMAEALPAIHRAGGSDPELCFGTYPGLQEPIRIVKIQHR